MARDRFATLALVIVALMALLMALASPAMGQANVQGKWNTSTLIPINPIHVALLANGKILIVAGSGNCPPSQQGCPSGPPYGPSNNSGATLYDPVAGTFTPFSLQWDTFCNGMVLLPDGRAFINGGTIQYDPFHGELRSTIFDPATNTFTDAPSMAHGRWYPTVLTLGDGRIMSFSGLDENGVTNKTVEIYTVGAGWGQEYLANWTPDLYPRLHLLPNGTVLYSQAGTGSNLFDPATNTWTTDIANTNYSGHRGYGSSVLLPLTPTNNYDPKVMIMGGNSPATATTEIIDMGAANPQWQWGPNMSQPRIEMNAVILPNGKVLALGGSTNDEDLNTLSLNADLYDPATNTFSSAGANSFERLYHSVALLLPDATVWVAGGNPDRGTYEPHSEVYQPAYLFLADGSLAPRPTISSAPPVISWGNPFTVQTPDAANISSVVLVRNGTVTHAFGMDQRIVGMSFTPGTGSLTVTAPPNGNIAPPGYYMLFILNNSGVPSQASFIQLAQQPDFSIDASPSEQTVVQGSNTSYTVNVTAVGGFSGTVGLSVTGLPTGASGQFNPTTITGSGSSTLTVTTASNTPVGQSNLTITGTAGALSHQTGVTLTVTAPGTPTVTGVNPNGGPIFGGTAVTISGTNFMSGATATLGGTAATNVVVVNSTTITATTAAHAAGAVTVTVTNPGGQNGSLANGYTYSGTATISFAQVAVVEPPSPAQVASVTFPGAQTAGDLNIVVVGWFDTTSTVSSVVDSQGNTYSLAIGPTSGNAIRQSIYYAKNIVAGNNTVTVTFNQAATYPEVQILEYRGLDTSNPLDMKAGAFGNSSSASSGAATTTSANELIFGAGSTWGGFTGAGTGFTTRIITSYFDISEDRVVSTSGSYSAVAPLDGNAWVMQMATFKAASLLPAPTVTGVSPNNGPAAGGTAITISGTNFVSGATATLGGTAATNVVVINSTTITATTAAHAAGAVAVTVTNPDTQSGSLANGYTYLGAAPTVTGVSPNNGPAAGGTAITISGTNFVSGATPTLGGTAATNVVVVNNTTITATTAAHAAGAVTVTVTNPDTQSGSLTNGFTYNAAPTVTSVSPNNGPAAGGTAITISGTNFVSGATAKLGGTAATNVVVVSSTTITATTAAHAAGAVTVTVTNPDTQSGSLTNGFTYNAAPTVTSVSPNNGPAAGGTAITISGTNFVSGATAMLGGTAATNVVVVNSTTITATTAAHAAGAVTVTVTNPDTQSGSLANGYTYLGAAPTVTGVSPNNGPAAGGTAITISGTNFVSGATAKLGGTAATNVVVVSSTTITATTAAHAAGAVTVTVTNPDTQSGSLTNGFTYNAAPTVTSVSPNNGPAAGGTAITISGTNFVSGATATLGGTAATNVVVINSTTITATTAAHAAGAVAVTVTNPDTQSGSLANGYTYLGAAPTVTGVSPNNGPAAGGTAITISGTNFVSGATATLGGTAATNVVVVNNTTITATTAAHAAGAVTVTVTNPDTQSGSLTNGFTYNAAPTVTSVSPNNGPAAGGTAITISGTNFVSGATAKLGGTAATNVVVVSSTTITATTAAHAAGAVTVTVTNPDTQSGSLTNGFTYNAAPTVTSVSPNNGPAAGGTAITISGTNFVSGATAMLGGTAATNVVVVNSTTITATTAAHAAGAVTVTVTNPDTQSGSLTNGFTYTSLPAPTVTGVSPNNGPAAGGTAITISGTNFVSGATATLGGTAATNVVVVNSTTITATTAAHAAGAVTVTVTNPDTQSGSLTNGFTYNAAPTVTSVSPNNGPAAGGTAITISGTNFVSGATATLGGTAATNVVVVNSTTITATTAAHAAGAVTVTVTNPGGQNGSLASGYTYNGAATISFAQVAAVEPPSPAQVASVAFPRTQTAGDLNIVVVGWFDTTSTVSSVVDSQGNTYSLAIGPTSGNTIQQSIYYAKNIQAGSNTVTVTFNQAATYPEVQILEYKGVSTLDVTAGAFGNSKSASSGAATTTSANELIFGAGSTWGGFTGAGTGFTTRIITSYFDISEDRVVSTSGSYKAVAPLNGDAWVMQMATFK